MTKFEIPPPSNTISFHSMNSEWVMRITADRRIEVAEGVDVTEAARLVLDAMQSMLDVGLEKAVLAEPVAWMYESVCGNNFTTRNDPPSYAKNIKPLYTHPPQRIEDKS
jgi:hypothetical protein